VIAKTVAEMTSQQDNTIQELLIKQLIAVRRRESRREEAISAVGSSAKHQRRFGSSECGTNLTPPPCWTSRGSLGYAWRGLAQRQQHLRDEEAFAVSPTTPSLDLFIRIQDISALRLTPLDRAVGATGRIKGGRQKETGGRGPPAQHS
jgi:hypothetical protein